MSETIPFDQLLEQVNEQLEYAEENPTAFVAPVPANKQQDTTQQEVSQGASSQAAPHPPVPPTAPGAVAQVGTSPFVNNHIRQGEAPPFAPVPAGQGQQGGTQSVQQANTNASTGQQASVYQQNTQQSNATTYGQQSNATVYGQQSNVTVYGQPSNATVYGQQSNATVYGQQSNATVYGQQSNATAYGQQSNATVYGAPTNATVYQGGGNLQPAGNGTQQGALSVVAEKIPAPNFVPKSFGEMTQGAKNMTTATTLPPTTPQPAVKPAEEAPVVAATSQEPITQKPLGETLSSVGITMFAEEEVGALPKTETQVSEEVVSDPTVDKTQEYVVDINANETPFETPFETPASEVTSLDMQGVSKTELKAILKELLHEELNHDELKSIIKEIIVEAFTGLAK